MFRSATTVLVAGLLCGCGRAPDAADALAETARQSVDTPRDRADTAVAAEARAAIGGADVRLPDDFPDDVQLPEQYAVVSVTTMGPTQSVVLRSDTPVAALFERFRTAQAGRGWEETVSMHGAEGAMLGFRKGRRGVVANFRPDMEGRTLVSLSLQPHLLPERR